GFEPSVPLPVHTLSRRAPSASAVTSPKKRAGRSIPTRTYVKLAEREGFEPPVPSPVHLTSSPPPSTSSAISPRILPRQPTPPSRACGEKNHGEALPLLPP